MNIQDKITYWQDIALYDLETAELLDKNGRYLYAAFMCQQALEKILKALYLHRFSKEAPHSHNLVYLESLLELNMSKNRVPLLAELTAYYIEGRYPSYKAKLSTLIDKKKSSMVEKTSRELFEWLQEKLK